MWDLFHLNAPKVILPTVIVFDLTLSAVLITLIIKVVLITLIIKVVLITVIVEIVLIGIIIKVVVIYCIIGVKGWVSDVVSLPYLLLLIVDRNANLLLLKTLLQIFGQIRNLCWIVICIYRFISVFLDHRYWLLSVYMFRDQLWILILVVICTWLALTGLAPIIWNRIY